jgi:hypothetical protein
MAGPQDPHQHPMLPPFWSHLGSWGWTFERRNCMIVDLRWLPSHRSKCACTKAPEHSHDPCTRGARAAPRPRAPPGPLDPRRAQGAAGRGGGREGRGHDDGAALRRPGGALPHAPAVCGARAPPDPSGRGPSPGQRTGGRRPARNSAACGFASRLEPSGGSVSTASCKSRVRSRQPG